MLLQRAGDRENVAGVVVDDQDLLPAQSVVPVRLEAVRDRAFRCAVRQDADLVAGHGGQVHGDPLAQLVERGHQLQRPVAEPQPGQPRLRAVQLVAGVRKYGQAGQARLVLQLLQERERRSVRHAEIEDHAPARERPQRLDGLVRADGRLHPDRSGGALADHALAYAASDTGDDACLVTVRIR